MTNIHHPTPVNQFYRLDRETPTSPLVKTSRWNHIHGTTNFDGALCMAGEGAVALDAHTGGRIRTNPGAIHDQQGDRSGGIGIDDVRTAWLAGWSQYLLTPGDFGWDDVMHAVRVQRRHVAIGVDYDLVPYDYRVQKSGSFDHAIGLDDYRASDGRILRYDTLDTKAVWTPQSAFRAAAEALAFRVRGNRGRLFVGLTASRPLLVSDKWTVVIHPIAGSKGFPTYRYFGVYTVIDDVVTKVVTRRTGGLSASADRRKFYSYPGHAKQELVRLTSGYLKDFYVRAGYIEEE